MKSEVHRNDIDGIIKPNLDLHSYDVLIYDNVSGLLLHDNSRTFVTIIGALDNGGIPSIFI